MHDPRVGRFFAVDPLASKYPFYSPYSFSGNRVTDMVELEGLEPAKYDMYLNNNLIGSTIDDFGGVTGRIVRWTEKNGVGEVVNSYDIYYQFVEFVETTRGPVAMPSGYEMTGISAMKMEIDVNQANEMFDESIDFPTGALVQGLEKAGSGFDNLWVKDKDRSIVSGSHVSSRKMLNGGTGRVLRAITKKLPIVGAVLDGIEIGRGMRKDGGFGRNAKIQMAGAVGGTLGGSGGAWAGAATGAAIGSIIPGVGTAIGGVVGGIVGAFFGSWGGEKAAEKATDSILKE